MAKWSYVFIFGVVGLLSGCANLMSVHRTTNFSDGNSSFVDIKQRGVFSNPHHANGNGPRNVICAEPSPDALSAYSADISAKLTANSSKSLAYAQGLREGAAFTGTRSQTIQLLRDSRYRDCEAYMNGAMDSGEYGLAVRRHQKLTIALMAIEQLLGANPQPAVVIGAAGRASVNNFQELNEKQSELDDEIDKLKAQTNEEDLSEDQKKALGDLLKSKEKEKIALDAKLRNAIDAEVVSSVNPSYKCQA